MRHNGLSLLALFLGWIGFSPTGQAQPPSFINLGSIGNSSLDYFIADRTEAVALTAGQVQWYRFVLDESASSGAGRFLDIDTTPNINGTNSDDTIIGLYTSTGTLVTVDDDRGPTLYSQLTFGLTTPLRGPIHPFGFTAADFGDGFHGDLSVGTYFLAVTQFAASFNPNFDVTTNSTTALDFDLNFRTNITAIPEPASVGLIALFVCSGLYLGYRRRNAWRSQSEAELSDESTETE